MKSEKDIEKELWDFLDALGFFPIKVENANIHKSKRTFNKRRRKGHSDLVFFYDNTAFYCEVKTPLEYRYIIKHFSRLENGEIKSKENITEQIDFIKNVRVRGQEGLFCSGVDNLIETMRLMGYDNFPNSPKYNQ